MKENVFRELKFLSEEDRNLINKSEMARRIGCDRRTVDKYLDNEIPKKRKERA